MISRILTMISSEGEQWGRYFIYPDSLFSQLETSIIYERSSIAMIELVKGNLSDGLLQHFPLIHRYVCNASRLEHLRTEKICKCEKKKACATEKMVKASKMVI